LCVGAANKAVVAKQWQYYTSVCFHPGGNMSDRLLEQCIIKFYARLGNSVSATPQMLTEAYGADAVKESSVFEWHKRFKEGREDVKDNERTGHLKTHRTDENVEKVWKLVRCNR
jgi:hypothetical protein